MTEGVRLVVDHNVHVRFDPGEVGDDEGVADLEGVLEHVELAVLVVAKLESVADTETPKVLVVLKIQNFLNA